MFRCKKMSGQKRFEGKVVIVTGSSAGIGRATLLRIAKEGGSVVIHGQSKEKLEAVKKELNEFGVDEKRYLVVSGSLEEEATQDRIISETIKRFGKLDILINNAATAGKAGVIPNSMEAYDFIMGINVRAIYRMIQLAIPHLEKTKGSIVNITSDLSERPFPRSMPYSISKAALNHLTKNYAKALAEKGIRVNAVGAGLTNTDFATRIGIPEETLKAVIAETIKTIPLQRISEADEQAEIIVNIASPTNNYMTGSVIFNDGGLLLGQ